MKPSTRLRQRLAAGGTLVKPGAFDALSALVIERAGFECCGVSGYGVSAALLGRPDAGFTTLSEMVMVARYITGAVTIPVIADADTGFGNALNTMRTVEDFIGAGVAAIHIEDQVAPKRCGHVAGKQLIPLEEAVGKIRAADRVRRELDPEFLLIARCDARGAAGGGMEELLRRSRAYLDAGADMIFPEALLSEEELERCVREIPGPLHYNRTGVSPLVPLERLNELGIAMVSNATGAVRASLRAMWDYLQSFATDDAAFLLRFKAEGEAHPAGDLHAFLGFPQLRALENEFLPTADVLARYAGSLGYQP